MSEGHKLLNITMLDETNTFKNTAQNTLKMAREQTISSTSITLHSHTACS